MMIMKDDIIVGLCSYDNDPDLWFAEGVMEAPRGRPTPDEIKVSIIRTADALRICSNCPVINECRKQGMSEEFGVWGGLTRGERLVANNVTINKNNIWSVKFAATVRKFMEENPNSRWG